MIFGLPQIIICDNAANLNSELMKRLYKLTKSRKINVTAYRPQGNSVERFHKDLGPYLRNFIENKYPWAELIQFGTFSHNSSSSEVTTFSPFELVFGRKPISEISSQSSYTYDDYVSQLKLILNKTKSIAGEARKQAKDKNKERTDKGLRNIQLKPGEMVFIENIRTGQGQKLQNMRNGPFKVVKILNEQNIIIQMGSKEKVVHKNLLTKYVIPN